MLVKKTATGNTKFRACVEGSKMSTQEKTLAKRSTSRGSSGILTRPQTKRQENIV